MEMAGGVAGSTYDKSMAKMSNMFATVDDTRQARGVCLVLFWGGLGIADEGFGDL